jgi:hypothetical protein
MTTVAPSPPPTTEDGRHRAVPPAVNSRLRRMFTGAP